MNVRRVVLISIVGVIACFALRHVLFHYTDILQKLPSNPKSAEFYNTAPKLLVFLAVVITGPFMEEMLFRLPVGLVAHDKRLTVTAGIVSSILFGLAHGSVWNIAFQGVGGVILTAVFYWGGAKDDKTVDGFAASWLTHSLYNASVFFIAF